jgi:hypothetical protein
MAETTMLLVAVPRVSSGEKAAVSPTRTSKFSAT